MDDRRGPPLSISYRILRCLLGLIAVLVRRDLSKDAELLVLRHENTVLRHQLTRVRYTPADRMWLAAVSRLLPRRRWTEVFAITPATILAWPRRLISRTGDYPARRQLVGCQKPAAVVTWEATCATGVIVCRRSGALTGQVSDTGRLLETAGRIGYQPRWTSMRWRRLGDSRHHLPRGQTCRS